MTQRLRDPYVIKVRGAKPGTKLPDSDTTLYGEAADKGVETLTASEHGAVVVRLWRQSGKTMAKVTMMPWRDFAGVMRGQRQTLYAGPIDGNWPDPQLIRPPKERA